MRTATEIRGPVAYSKLGAMQTLRSEFDPHEGSHLFFILHIIVHD